MDIAPLWWVTLLLSISTLASVYISVILAKNLAIERYRRRQMSSSYGKMTEQFLPLAAAYPWDARYFRFLGSPIDGVQFNDDQIVLVEFKSGRSKLSERQRNVRKLVQDGKVTFREIRIDVLQA